MHPVGHKPSHSSISSDGSRKKSSSLFSGNKNIVSIARAPVMSGLSIPLSLTKKFQRPLNKRNMKRDNELLKTHTLGQKKRFGMDKLLKNKFVKPGGFNPIKAERNSDSEVGVVVVETSEILSKRKKALREGVQRFLFQHSARPYATFSPSDKPAMRLQNTDAIAYRPQRQGVAVGSTGARLRKEGEGLQARSHREGW